MGGRAEPPEGGPEGGAGGEDEFRPVVFDESFIRAARIQELSADERLSGAHRSVRRRGGRGGLPRQAVALMLLIGFAFATAVYMGVRHPYPTPVSGVAANLSVQIVPLRPGPSGIPTGRAVPTGPATGVTASVPPTPSGSGSGSATGTGAGTAAGSGAASGSAGGTPSASASTAARPALDPAYDGLPGGEFLAIGETGFNLPNARHTDHFSHDQVSSALQTVQGYLKTSSLDPDVLVGEDTDKVREWISPGQWPQFDAGVDHPTDDQRHETTGWMVRFNPKNVRLATSQVLVAPGEILYDELDPNTLQVTSDYTFLYALSAVPKSRPSASPPATADTPSASAGTASGAQPVVYFVVRRALTYWLTPDDIASHHVQLVDSVVQAGATSCEADNSAFLQPLFPPVATRRVAAAAPGASSSPTTTPRPGASSTPGVINPFDHKNSAWTVCGQLTGLL